MFRKTRPQWYVNTVAEKKNESWSLQDMTLVYTLRVKENRPVEEVMKILKNKGHKKTNKIKVYNLTRLSRKALLGKCIRCGQDLSEQELISKKKGRILFLCKHCKKEAMDMKKQRREKFLRHGMCGVCGKRKHLPGNTSCQSCLSAVSRRRIAHGLCGTCGKHPIDRRSIHQCTTCLELNHLRTRLATIH